MVEPGRDARPRPELAGAELRPAAPVDLTVPATEVAVREHAKGELAAQLEQRRPLGLWPQRHSVAANPVPTFEEDRGQALELDPEIRLGSIERHPKRYRGRNPKLGRPAGCRDLTVPAEALPGRGVAPQPEADRTRSWRTRYFDDANDVTHGADRVAFARPSGARSCTSARRKRSLR